MSKTEPTFTSTAPTFNKSPTFISPTLNTFHHDKGAALYCLGRNQDALRCFDKILQQNPSDLSAHTYKIDILLRMNRYQEAITSCDTLLKVSPDFPVALYNKVCALASSGLREEASNCYHKASQCTSYEASTCFYQGKALFYMDKKNEAIDLFGQAIEKSNGYVDAHVHQGNALYASGNHRDAVASFKRAAKIEPNYSDAFYGLGKALFALGKHTQALEAFQKVIELNPDSPHAYNSAGVASSAMGDKLGAIAFFSKAIKQNPVHALYYCNKGKALSDMGKGDEALACFNKADSLSHGSKLGGGLSPGNIKYINRVLAEDRIALIKQLKDLQAVTLETQKVIAGITQDDSDSKHIVETFAVLKRSASEATSEAINGLNAARSGVSKHKSSLALKERLDIQHKEMESLLAQISQLQHQQSTYGHKLSEHEVKIDEHEDILEASGAKARAEIKEGFESLRSTNPELYAYCKTFYWTAINLFGAYRSLSTDIIQGDLHERGLPKEVLFIAGAKKLASYGSAITQGIPLLGGVLGAMDGLIDSLYTAVKQHQLSNKVSSINRVIQRFGTEEDISLGVAKIALAMTYAKKQGILNHDLLDNRSDNSLKRAAFWMQEKLENIKQSILPSIELHDKNSSGAMLALEDVVMMFVYMCKNSGSIVRNSRSIEEQLASIVKYGELDKLMISAVEGASSTCIYINFHDEFEEESTPTPPPSPTHQHNIADDPAREPAQLAGEESHCCCSVS